MVQPTVLKKKHSLKGVRLLALIKRVKPGKPESLKEFSRMTKDIKTEDLSYDEINQLFLSLTGEPMREILELAERDDNLEEARWMLHCTIIYANEYGQPTGQNLIEPESTGSAGPSTSGAAVCSNTTKSSEKGKRKRDDDLEDRVASLEKNAKIEAVKELKDKLRALSLQQEPSNSLILLTLEELAKTARRVDHEDSEIFEELARQASRHQEKVDISAFCLSVLGGKAADTITKALSKCIKGKQSEVKSDTASQKVTPPGPRPEDSPLHNAYPPVPYQTPMAYGMPPPQYFAPNGPYMGNNFRGRPRGQFTFRPRGACLFCDSQTHQVRDCQLMKDARDKGK